jgi:hypothetical protein
VRSVLHRRLSKREGILWANFLHRSRLLSFESGEVIYQLTATGKKQLDAEESRRAAATALPSRDREAVCGTAPPTNGIGLNGAGYWPAPLHFKWPSVTATEQS